MAMWLQNLVVLIAVVGCLAFVTRQIVSALAGRKSKIGSCCAKGCGTASPAKPQVTGERVVFLPVEMLRKR
jgi:hypothetical protein